MAITLTKLSNGLLFDLSTESGAGTTKPKFIFRPSANASIIQTKVFDNRFEYTAIEKRDFVFSFDGSYADGSTLNSIAGVAPEDNYDLFTKFNALL